MLIKGYESYKWVNEAKFKIDNNFNKKLYNMFKQPTFVFIRQEHYDLLNPRLQQECKSLGKTENDMTIDDILNEKIMYAITLDNSEDEINAIVSLVERYTKKSMKYLVLEI